MKQEAAIHIGTSGWSYQHWKQLYYPLDLSEAKWLEFYAETFKVSEINTSFYHLPKQATTKGWSGRVPKDFKFCPKMSRYLTHMKKLNDPEESMERFFDAFMPLKRKTGPVLIQLPHMVKFNAAKAENLYRLCKKSYAYYTFAMEVRHESWMTEESIALMKKYNIAFVISQSGSAFPYAEFVTAQHIYVRFHGPGALYASKYTTEHLQKFAELFLNWQKQGHSVWAFFNNDIGGHAITNAKELQELTTA
jgi:uncharacterized protein YecE (DUF72 family)